MKPQFYFFWGVMVLAVITVTIQVQSAAPDPVQLEDLAADAGAGQEVQSQAPAGMAPPLSLDSEGWEAVAEGIAYKKFHLPDPNNIYVARMDRGAPNVTIESSLGQGRLSGGREAVSGMAGRYDQTINYWGGAWGARNKVVVAINGSYFDPYSGVPYQGVVHSGWYAKRFDDCQTGSGGSGFAWKMDGSAFIGGTVSHPEEKQTITFLKSGKTQALNGLNVARGSDELILYTPQFDKNTRTDEYGVEVLVEMQQPDLLSAGAVKGFVREIRKSAGSTPIPFDHVVLSAAGTAKTKLINNVEVGDEISISQRIKSYEAGCDSAQSSIDWNGAYASIGGAFFFLKDGEIYDFPEDKGATDRHPRTAIAYNEQYIYFIVVDGRDPYLSVGMTIKELAAFTRDSLDAAWGIAQDGGGSSTMVINGRVMNNTYCNNVFCSTKIFLPLTIGGNMSEEQRLAHQAEGPSALSPASYPAVEDPNLVLTSTVERLVANGMLMVVVEPAALSKKIQSTSPSVKTADEAEVRLGPGANYAVLASVEAGTEGDILEHLSQLNGVFATGSYWWKVNLGDVTGWVKEESLAFAGR